MTIFKKYAALFLLSSFAIGGITAQTITSKSPHSDAHKQLLANQAKSKDQIRLVEKNTFIDLIDDIEPEPDIYTEGWNSKAVNPFKESDVPDTQVIDVTGYVMPVPGKVTSNYGYRRRFGRMHKGIDLAIRNNDTIYAAFDGKCRLTAYERKGYGNYVILRHPNGLETVYGHRTFIESICIRVRGLVCEVEDCRRIYGVSHETGLKVEVRTGASSGASTQTDRVAGFHHLVSLYEWLVEVSVYGFKSVGVAKDHVVAITLSFVSPFHGIRHKSVGNLRLRKPDHAHGYIYFR